jgi:hypothetical protein
LSDIRTMVPPVSQKPIAGSIVDPTTIRPTPPDQPFPTGFAFVDARDVKTPNLGTAGNLRPVEDWAKELSSDPMTAVKQVGAALTHTPGKPYQYNAYGADLSKVRPSINEGLANGGGECDWFAAVGYFALTSSGRFKKEDVAVMQVFASGGWHNVVTFKNPNTGKWDILDYSRVVSVGADSQADAMRAYFGNHELGIVYRTDDPNEKAAIAFRVRSDHQATISGLMSQPGIGAAMSPTFGSLPGLNEGKAFSPAGAGLGSTGSGLAVQAGPFSVDARMGPKGPDRIGASVLVPTKDGDLAGGKLLIARDASGKGAYIFAGGEWWRLRENSYIGVVAGAELRVGAGTQRLETTTLTSLAPALSVNGGVSGDIIGDKQSRFQWSWFTNGRLQVLAPLVLTAPGRAEVDGNSNGVSAGGVLDPGFLGLAAITLNAGTQFRYQIDPRLSVQGSLIARAEAQDPTLSGSPVAPGVFGDAHLAYRSSDVQVDVGARAGYGIYDRDVMWGLYGAVGLPVGASGSLSTQVGVGQFTDKTGYGYLHVGGSKTFAGGQSINAGLGLTATGTGESVEIMPSLGASVRF